MHLTDHGHNLRIDLDTKGPDLPPAEVRLGRWLEGLIDGALPELLRAPDAVTENVELARTLVDTPQGDPRGATREVR